MELDQLRNFDTTRSKWTIKEPEHGKTTACDNYLARKIYQDAPTLNGGERGGA